ncbi:hypothetical protein FGO68_gene16278 [Halteria grandinella]|uniref:Uncharacterized protein n=1 Tax=Halteria grandinella TaxID=5974 RepID=A0A8J8TA60_HALGN|nr:hypothetical protein FGO68_gene16278 [Halteria grandinella]
MMSFQPQLQGQQNHPTGSSNSNTQTNRDTRSRKFSFPRNSSFTNESISEATDNAGASALNHAPGFNLAYSQIDARSHAGTDDHNPFDPAASSSHGGGILESRLWRRLDTDKMIQYEELASKGSERPASMFGPTNHEGQRGGGTAQGVGTSNSIMVSGTPTDASNYYNQQTFFQINYIGGGANRQNAGLTNQASAGVKQDGGLNKFRSQQRNRGSSNSRYHPTQFLNNNTNGGLSSLSHNQGYQYPNSAGGFYHETNTVSSALQRSNSKSSMQALVQDLDFGQYLNHSSYLQGQALLSPRHIRQAVLKYDKHFQSRDLRWSDYSILQKLLYLFENQKSTGREILVRSAFGGNQANMRIENNGVISEHGATSHGNRASTSLNHHRTSRLANASHLEQSANNEQYKPNSSGKLQKEMLQNMIGSIEIKEIKQFIENFRSEDHLEKHQKAQEMLLEEQRIQIFQKNQRIEFLEKKIELLEEQSMKMKDRLHQNIEQYEHEIKIKDEIHNRERNNLMEQICSQMDDLEKSKKEATLKNQQLQDQLDRINSFNATDPMPKYPLKSGAGRSQTQVGNAKLHHTNHDLGHAIRNLNQRKNQERLLNASMVVQQNDFLNMTTTDFYQPLLVDSAIGQNDFNTQMDDQIYEPQIIQQPPHHRQSSANNNSMNAGAAQRRSGKSIRESLNTQQQHKSSGKSVGAPAQGNLVLRSDQIRRKYTNTGQKTYFSPNGAGAGVVRRSQNNSLSANAKPNISVVDGQQYHPFEQTMPQQFQGQYNQVIMPSYINQKQQLLAQHEVDQYQTDQLGLTQQFTNRAVSQNYQTNLGLKNSNAVHESVPNSGRSKTPNDHGSIKQSHQRQGGDLARQLRMVTGSGQQRRLFNGSVDFNQTDTLANQYIAARIAAGGSVSPHHASNLRMEGFNEDRYDNLNQTVQLTLGHQGQLIQNPVNYSIGSSRSQIKRGHLASDQSKKRDIIARSSIESHRQFGSPVPLSNNDRVRIGATQIEGGVAQMKSIRASQNVTSQETGGTNVGSRGQKLKIKVANDQIKRQAEGGPQQQQRLASIQSTENYNLQQQQQPIAIPAQVFQMRPATAGSKSKFLSIKNQQLQQNYVVVTRASQESLQQVYDPSGINNVNPTQYQSTDIKPIKIIDSARVKLKPAGQHAPIQQQLQTNILGKNIKISPYQINWNPATKQVIPASKQQVLGGMRGQSNLAQGSTRQLQPQMSIPQTNMNADGTIYSNYQTSIENPQMSQSPLIPQPTSKIVGNFKTRAIGKSLLSDRNTKGNNAGNNILVHDTAQVNNWFQTDDQGMSEV